MGEFETKNQEDEYEQIRHMLNVRSEGDEVEEDIHATQGTMLLPALGVARGAPSVMNRSVREVSMPGEWLAHMARTPVQMVYTR